MQPDAELPIPRGVPPVTIRLSLFFDGTRNNKYNVQTRLEVEEEKACSKTGPVSIPEWLRAASADAERAGLEAIATRTAGLDPVGASGGAVALPGGLLRAADANGLPLDATNQLKRANKSAVRGKSAQLIDEASYQNDFSNVARLFQAFEPTVSHGVDVYAESLYIPGPGTTSDGKDDLRGFAFGAGSTGIEKRVDDCLSEIVGHATEALKKVRHDSVLRLKVIIFGFSRGAAAARHLVWRLYGADAPRPFLPERFARQALTLTGVEVDFLGLFDTVSSHEASRFSSLSPDFADDVADLRLNRLAPVGRVVHLMAADEHREVFALTTAQSATESRCTEVYLPGAHSDVGGGYVDHQPENRLKVFTFESRVTKSRNKATAATIERAKLEWDWLAERGWCEPRPKDGHSKPSLEPDLCPASHRRGCGVIEIQEDELFLTRCVRNSYTYVPMRIMARFAEREGFRFRASLRENFRLDKMLKAMSVDGVQIEEYLWQLANAAGLPPQATAPHPLWLRQLRGGYFHMSAEYSTSAHAFRPMYCLDGRDDATAYGATGEPQQRGSRRRLVNLG